MKIENNVLYRDHYDYQPVSLAIHPHLDSYNDTDCDLSFEQEAKQTDEIRILEAFTHLKSVRKFFQLDGGNIVTMSQYAELLDSVKEDIKKNNMPESLLNNIFCLNDDGYPSLYMIPNKDFPICSILALKNAKNSIMYSGGNITQRRWSLVDDYEKKVGELKECSDQKFVAKCLEPLQKKIDEFDAQNTEELKKIQKREADFNKHIEFLGLKKEFDILENPPKEIEEEVVKPTKATKTTKKRKM